MDTAGKRFGHGTREERDIIIENEALRGRNIGIICKTSISGHSDSFKMRT